VGREVTVKETVADSIAEIAWYIESKGLVATAENSNLSTIFLPNPHNQLCLKPLPTAVFVDIFFCQFQIFILPLSHNLAPSSAVFNCHSFFQ